jgi:hypothetical protein
LTFRYRNKQIFFLFWKKFFICKLSSRRAADRGKKIKTFEPPPPPIVNKRSHRAADRRKKILNFEQPPPMK